MNGRSSAFTTPAIRDEQFVRSAADAVSSLRQPSDMQSSSSQVRIERWIWTLCLLCLFIAPGCSFSRNLLGKAVLQAPAAATPTTANPAVAAPNCSAPGCAPQNTQAQPPEPTAYPVPPQPSNQVPAHGAAAQATIPAQPQPGQQTMVQPQPQVAPQPASATAQQLPPQQPLPQPLVNNLRPTEVQTAMPVAANQTQNLPPQNLNNGAQPNAGQSQTVPQGQSQSLAPEAQDTLAQLAAANQAIDKLPPAIITPQVDDRNHIGGPELTSTPRPTYRALQSSGPMAAAQCPPGMIPRVSHGDDIISTPEKLAECEKQVHEMNEKLSTLQFQTMQARAEMEEMAQQQRQLQLDNQLLRLRAEKADKQYLEELDSLSQIVGDVVSRANSTNKPSPGIRSSTNSTPLQSVPQSVAPGQSL